MVMLDELKARIERSWNADSVDAEAVQQVLTLLDQGRVRVAEKVDGTWVVN
ncbi:MAG: hypothetical protein ACI9MC_002567, partial [Kiritimatiellia bacterium]